MIILSGLITIGTAVIIFINGKAIVKKLQKSNLIAYGLVIAVFAVVARAAQLLLTGGH
jgi:hypothetical protein